MVARAFEHDGGGVGIGYLACVVRRRFDRFCSASSTIAGLSSRAIAAIIGTTTLFPNCLYA